jgi:hypothetical protein
MVNGEEAGVITPVKCNDIINVKESTVGEDGHMKAGGLDEYKKGIFFIINGKQVRFERKIKVNGREEGRDYDILTGDSVEISDYINAGELFKKLDVPEGHKLILNNRVIDLDNFDPYEKIYENYIIDIVKNGDNSISQIVNNKPETKDKDEETSVLKDRYEQLVEKTKVLSEELDKIKSMGVNVEGMKVTELLSKDVQVTVNNVPVLLQGKHTYTFVDVLDFYPFNTSTLQGTRIVCKRNGAETDFFSPVAEGDILELYWA